MHDVSKQYVYKKNDRIDISAHRMQMSLLLPVKCLLKILQKHI